jgi:hypothetical protein
MFENRSEFLEDKLLLKIKEIESNLEIPGIIGNGYLFENIRGYLAYNYTFTHA